MAIVQYEGQQLQIKDEIAADNQRLIAILRSNLPDVVNSVFERHTTEDGQAIVKIVRKPLTQLDDSISVVLDKPQLISDKQLVGTTQSNNSQLEVEEQESSPHERKAFAPAYSRLQYRAIGLVRGQYFPSAEDMINGILVTDDGTIAPTSFLASSLHFLKTHLELLNTPQFFVVYPITRVEPPYLHFTVKGIQKVSQEDPETLLNQKDCFNIRGMITYIGNKDKKFITRIYRNETISEAEPKSQKFSLLTIKGTLASEAHGQFADLEVRREGDQLILEKASFVAQLLQPKQQKQKKKKSRRRSKAKADGSTTSGTSQQ